MNNNDQHHSGISPTARIPAYWRSLSDIPFSLEIAEAVNAEAVARELLVDKISVMRYFAGPMLESRYKCVSHGLQKSGTEHVLELACGLCPRGLEIASRKSIYVGTDLPGIISETEPLIGAMASRAGIDRQYLRYQAANVLELDQLEAAAEYFNGSPFGICHEGLLMYLDSEEKALMADHVRKLLSRHGGHWVTTDVVFNVEPEDEKAVDGLEGLDEHVRLITNHISNQVGRNQDDNNFASEAEAIKFYKDLGFEIEQIPRYDGSYSLSTLASAPESVKRFMIETLSADKIWIMSPR